jgi:carboxyl-terminal processing protease
LPPLSAALALAFLLSSVLAPVAPAQAAPVANPEAAPTEQVEPRRLAQQVQVIRRAYDLLLDQFIRPIEPTDLLGVAYTRVAERLAESGYAPRDTSPVFFESSSERAWSSFAARLENLVEKSTAPPELNVAAIAVDAMARWLDEGHTAYLSPEVYKSLLDSSRGEGSYPGIGVAILQRAPFTVITDVFSGSPAEQAGLRPGDIIEAVDGQSIAGKPLLEISLLIRGPEGSSVKLEVRRVGEAAPLVFEPVRALVAYEFLTTRMIQGDVGYVKLRSWGDQRVADRLVRFVQDLPENGVRGLVIDLRGNTGGRVDVGVRVLNRFVESGPLFKERYRGGQERTESAAGPGWRKDIPIAILVDEGSASMSEIFASAMRERGLASIFGNKTAGVVAAARPYPLPDGSALLVANYEIFSGDGQTLDRNGVVPDVLLASSPQELAEGRDIPLEAAVLHLWAQSDRTAAQRAAAPGQ